MLFPVAVSTNMKCKVLNCQCNCSGDNYPDMFFKKNPFSAKLNAHNDLHQLRTCECDGEKA